MFCAIVLKYCTNGLLTCQFTFSWVCESPLCCERSYCHEQLTAAKVVNRLNTVSVVCRIYFPINTSIPSRGGIPGTGWSFGHRKQMLVLDFCQHVQETKDPDCAHEQRERNVYFLDVNFKWGENYKKHISRTQSQGQRPVRQAHLQRCSLETLYLYTSSSFCNCV